MESFPPAQIHTHTHTSSHVRRDKSNMAASGSHFKVSKQEERTWGYNLFASVGCPFPSSYGRSDIMLGRQRTRRRKGTEYVLLFRKGTRGSLWGLHARLKATYNDGPGQTNQTCWKVVLCRRHCCCCCSAKAHQLLFHMSHKFCKRFWQKGRRQRPSSPCAYTQGVLFDISFPTGSYGPKTPEAIRSASNGKS